MTTPSGCRAGRPADISRRHYHRVGLLEPTEVDPHTGYRRYTVEQIPTAQIIRRFRALDMPVEEVQAVLATPDVTRRNELIAAHLDRLEEGLAVPRPRSPHCETYCVHPPSRRYTTAVS